MIEAECVSRRITNPAQRGCVTRRIANPAQRGVRNAQDCKSCAAGLWLQILRSGGSGAAGVANPAQRVEVECVTRRITNPAQRGAGFISMIEVECVTRRIANPAQWGRS